MPNKSRLLAPLLAVALVGACTGDPAPPASGDPDGTSLVLAVATEPADLHPLAGFAPHGAAKLYDGLIEFQADLTPQPALAVDLPVPSADGKSWTVRLRSGVTFSDGTPFEAQDVVATYNALLDPARESPMRDRFAMLTKVTALDAATVRFDLSAPYVAFPKLLTLGIVSSESVATDKPVGTGPYRLESWTRGKRLVLAANKSYWDGAPAIRKVTVEFVPDDNVRTEMLRKGDLDGAALPPALAGKYEGADGMRVVYHSAADTRALVLPPSDPVAGNKDVRLALNYAVDRNAIVSRPAAGKARAAATPMPSVLAEFVDPDAGFDHDLTRAVDTLTAAGWVSNATTGMRGKNGVPGEIRVSYTPGDTLEAGIANALAADGAALGIKIEPSPTDTLTATAPALVNFGDPFDPDFALRGPLHPSGTISDYADPTAKAALTAGRAATDPAERATAYRKFQRAWVATPGMVVLASVNHTYVMRESWDGYQPVVDGPNADFTWGAWWNLEDWTPR